MLLGALTLQLSVESRGKFAGRSSPATRAQGIVEEESAATQGTQRAVLRYEQEGQLCDGVNCRRPLATKSFSMSPALTTTLHTCGTASGDQHVQSRVFCSVWGSLGYGLTGP